MAATIEEMNLIGPRMIFKISQKPLAAQFARPSGIRSTFRATIRYIDQILKKIGQRVERWSARPD